MELINRVPKFELSKMTSKNTIFQQTWNLQSNRFGSHYRYITTVRTGICL